MHETLQIGDQLEICRLAIHFFNPLHVKDVIQFTFQKSVEGRAAPFSVHDFLTYLEKSASVENPARFGQNISDILRRLESANILKLMGVSGIVFGERYYFIIFEGDKRNLQGRYWQAAALGPEFIYHFFSPYTVQITGASLDGQEHVGTGILVWSNKVLTCAHVLTDMKIHDTLTVGGQPRRITKQTPHEKVDVGLIEIEDVKDFEEHQIIFADPEILDEVYLMGFPKVPQIREAPLTIQKGEVNNTNATTFDGWKVFLFSAIARPGNSGGPIISKNGNIVGIVTRDLFALTEETEKKKVLPFFAGIPSHQISAALLEIDETISLPSQ